MRGQVVHADSGITKMPGRHRRVFWRQTSISLPFSVLINIWLRKLVHVLITRHSIR